MNEAESGKVPASFVYAWVAFIRELYWIHLQRASRYRQWNLLFSRVCGKVRNNC